MAPPKRRIPQLAAGTAACAPQGAAYAKCVVGKLPSVEQGDCQKLFIAFKECVQRKVGRRW
ncbi:hypothetical protein BJ684DRAFT_22138 [Piptocephalis cylindrospora]|uniref:CHCH domain-containing protein n=1 Tax=Piptocephalis cylindrospora TaxID=1907219 RepID=A0A4P9XZX9_9FUNG|nr:hypothetical protein BJ684DRAFT_22138 [Piptocephalis cylindrospora]|eukprot:RKP11311.1 hypothetical protein BJ684DRAFT_22138 [Piptocephalis cylindrospora]